KKTASTTSRRTPLRAWSSQRTRATPSTMKITRRIARAGGQLAGAAVAAGVTVSGAAFLRVRTWSANVLHVPQLARTPDAARCQEEEAESDHARCEAGGAHTAPPVRAFSARRSALAFPDGWRGTLPRLRPLSAGARSACLSSLPWNT